MIADLLGVSVRTVADFKHELPPESIDSKGRIYAPRAVQAWIARKIEQVKPPPASEEDALLMSGGADSPALERLRAATADIKERQRDELDRQLVRVDDIIDALTPAASIFRSAGERARRQFGNEVGDFYNETADEVCAEFDRVRNDLNGERKPDHHSQSAARSHAKRPASPAV